MGCSMEDLLEPELLEDGQEAAEEKGDQANE